jgi:drug/metabolite transporter (DMT)-like permease
MTQRPTLSDWTILAGLVVAWGSSFSMTKVAVSHVDPAWVMAMRLLIGGLFLLGYALLTSRRLSGRWQLWMWFLWLGIVGHAAPFFLISWGTQHVTSGLSGVLMGAIPLMVIVLAHVFLPDERLTVMKTAGFVIGFAGLLTVLGAGRLSGFSADPKALQGELAILLGCLCYAVHGIFARRIPYSAPVEQATSVCLCGAAVGILFALIVAPSGLATTESGAYWAILGLGIVPTGLATLMMYRIMRSCGVSFVAYSNYLVPVYALGFGAVTLNEPLSWNVGVGLVLILGGIAASRLSNFPLNQKSRPSTK